MTKTLYEGMFLVDSTLAAKDWSGVEKHILDLIGKNGGDVVFSQKWPDRRLAYEVKGCKKGTYYLTYFNAPNTALRELRRDVELSERILRALFVQERGLEEEMRARKNNEIEIPPADLSFGRERPGFDATGRPRRDRESGPEETGDKPELREAANGAPAVVPGDDPGAGDEQQGPGA